MAKKNYNYDPAFFQLNSRFMAVKREQTIPEDFK
jgi:hypothetical protein